MRVGVGPVARQARPRGTGSGAPRSGPKRRRTRVSGRKRGQPAQPPEPGVTDDHGSDPADPRSYPLGAARPWDGARRPGHFAGALRRLVAVRAEAALLHSRRVAEELLGVGKAGPP